MTDSKLGITSNKHRAAPHKRIHAPLTEQQAGRNSLHAAGAAWGGRHVDCVGLVWLLRPVPVDGGDAIGMARVLRHYAHLSYPAARGRIAYVSATTTRAGAMLILGAMIAVMARRNQRLADR